MIDNLLSLLAPHYCYGCGKMGSSLCINCKYDIISESYGQCIICESPTARDALCSRCRSPYQRAWCVGRRTDELQRLIGGFKFQGVRQAYEPLAELLDQALPELPPETLLVPIPTVRAHVRQRGYDHMFLIARALARMRKLEVAPYLQRKTATQQLGADRQTRMRQARTAFACETALNPQVPYLLLDDVVTTGATLRYGAKTLQAAGATTIWVATISRQPLHD
jgi:ComF family protein